MICYVIFTDTIQEVESLNASNFNNLKTSEQRTKHKKRMQNSEKTPFYQKTFSLTKSDAFKPIEAYVMIRKDYLRGPPFDSIIQRPALATIWSYYGDQKQVAHLLQRLSHRTRAYFSNDQKIIEAFLEPYSAQSIKKIVKSITEAQRAQIFMYQNVDQQTLDQGIDELTSKEALISDIQQRYPQLATYVMRFVGMDKELAEYREKCRNCRNDANNYYLHVHGFLLTWLDEQREAGLIKEGAFEGKLPGLEGNCMYTGEIDSQGLPTGEGDLLTEKGDCFGGTWIDGKLHGLCWVRKLDWHRDKEVGEWRSGSQFGKSTRYNASGQIINYHRDSAYVVREEKISGEQAVPYYDQQRRLIEPPKKPSKLEKPSTKKQPSVEETKEQLAHRIQQRLLMQNDMFELQEALERMIEEEQDVNIRRKLYGIKRVIYNFNLNQATKYELKKILSRILDKI